MKDLITISDFNKSSLLHLLEKSKFYKANPQQTLLQTRLMGCCFFEPSTRTRLSFETAMLRLGGKVVGFADSQTTAIGKGESLQDTIKIISQYVDLIVIRHPLDGAAQLAAEISHVPVINAGDGTNQHPTQTLVDLFSILESQGTLQQLHIAMVGDLKHSRTVHSLAHALIHFDSRLYFISPPSLEVPREVCNELREKGIKFSFHKSLNEVKGRLDLIYVARIQEERFDERLEFERVREAFRLTEKCLEGVKKNLKVFHALPRVNEIDREVDKTPHAYYFQQAANGVCVRQALLATMLEER